MAVILNFAIDTSSQLILFHLFLLSLDIRAISLARKKPPYHMVICTVRKFCEKVNSLTVIPSSFLIVHISLVGSVTIANGQIEWNQSTNFNRIQDGVWLKLSCV